jgi:iron uptake system component EfeO
MIARAVLMLLCAALLGAAVSGCGDDGAGTSGTAAGAAETVGSLPSSVPSTAETTGETGVTSGETDPGSETDTGADPGNGSDTTGGSSGGGSSGGGDPATSGAAVSGYRAYLAKQTASLATRTAAFSAALQRGDPERAVKLYPTTRLIYSRIAPVADRVRPGLADEIAATQADAPASGWAGFHLVEKTLFDTGTTEGTQRPGRALAADVAELRNGASGLDLDPSAVAAIAVGLIAKARGDAIDGKEERWSHVDITDIAGNVQGAGAAWKAIRPLVAARNKTLADATQNRYGLALTMVESFKARTGYRHHDELGDSEIGAIRETLENFAAQLEKIPPLLGA